MNSDTRKLIPEYITSDLERYAIQFQEGKWLDVDETPRVYTSALTGILMDVAERAQELGVPISKAGLIKHLKSKGLIAPRVHNESQLLEYLGNAITETQKYIDNTQR